MTVIALISDENNLNLVLPWASAFTKALRTSLTVVCWTHSPVAGTDNSGPVSQDLVQAVQDVISRTDVTEQTEIIGVSGPSDWKAAIGVARQTDAELIVAAANDPTGVTGATYPTNPLLKDSPCNTVVLFGDSTRSTEPRRIMVAATDNMNDVAALFLTSRMIDSHDARLTLARAELETEHVGLEVGRRELEGLIREAGVDHTDRVDCQVFETGDYQEAANAMDEHGLVVLGESPHLRLLSERRLCVRGRPTSNRRIGSHDSAPRTMRNWSKGYVTDHGWVWTSLRC